MNKRITSRLVACILVIATILSMAIPGYAIKWEGEDTDYTYDPSGTSDGNAFYAPAQDRFASVFCPPFPQRL